MGEACRAALAASVPIRSRVGIRRAAARSVDRRCPRPRTLASRIARREQRRVRRPRPRAAGRRRAVRDGRAGQRAARPRPGRDRQEHAAARDPPPRREAGWDAVRGRRARPGAGAGRRRAGAGRRVERGAPAGPDRHLRADERARRLPALDAPALAARRAVVVVRRPRRARARLVRGRLGDGRARAARWPPLSEHEARALLARLGPGDDRRAAAIARWAGGLPLALRLGAAAARDDPTWAPGADAAALRAHLRRVPEAALDGPVRRRLRARVRRARRHPRAARRRAARRRRGRGAALAGRLRVRGRPRRAA